MQEVMQTKSLKIIFLMEKLFCLISYFNLNLKID